MLPQCRADQGEEAGKAVRPLTQPGAEAQQDIGQQRRPDLPAHGVGAVAQKVGQLEGLFEFLEEGFDAPAAAIQVGDGRALLKNKMVGQENHFAELAVHLDEGGDAAQPDGMMFGGRTGQGDQVVAQNVSARSLLKFADDPALQVVLGAGDPVDAALGQISMH